VKRKRFSVEQITGILKQAELGTPIRAAVQAARGLGAKLLPLEEDLRRYGAFGARELKQLRDENVKLKRLVADLSLDKVMLRDVLQKKF